MFKDYLQGIENIHDDGSAVVDAPTLILWATNFYENKLIRSECGQSLEPQRECLTLNRIESKTQQ